ncbi:MAG: hypothetical protein IPI46_06090 [Bacteroidetes bacterium]|nr:hypothetical protein [Bacteroidota bacterium]
MAIFLQFFILLPLFTFIIALCIPAKNETAISSLAIGMSALQVLSFIPFTLYWLLNDASILFSKHIVFYQTEHLEIFFSLFYDKTSAVFGVVGSLSILLISIFSKYYLHRDGGFKRYFATILLFFAGYNITILSGNFETLFIGWEILGICSFLLISYYRDRHLPAKNAMKVISVYRIGDMGLILAMWMSHHIWHENITFMKYSDSAGILSHLAASPNEVFFISLMILLAAVVKSAQFPFSSWLPRAMEGPTSSSAIFYGSLSVHLGVFLLLRTYPYWEGVFSMKIIIISLGSITALLASWMSMVQSTVKTQIAYASITQIGLMFIEIALGWHILALVHFTTNAFLRSYQLLVSPSVLGYKIHNQFFEFKPIQTIHVSPLVSRIKNTFFMFSLKEWKLDDSLSFFFKMASSFNDRQRNISHKLLTRISLVVILVVGFIYEEKYHALLNNKILLIPYLYACIALWLILNAFASHADARQVWINLFLSQLFISFTVLFVNEDFNLSHIAIYLSGSVLSMIVGYATLHFIYQLDKNILLKWHHGYLHTQTTVGIIFLMACLGLIGLPFTPTFIGIDILFSHIHQHHIGIIILISLCFLFLELAALRMYARIFMGPFKKVNHPVAFPSS